MDNLADLASANPEELAERVSPALRAALERHVDGPAHAYMDTYGGFNSIIIPE